MGKSRSYTFDQAFDPATTQAEVFEVVGAPLVDSVLDGFNATIFAYGQTGSGKTYTMHGGDSQHGSHGLMLRAVEALFEGMERRAPDVSFRASCTYMQIYNEVCTDCLAPVSTSLPGAMAPPLRVREDGARVHVEGLRRAPLEGLADAERLLALGAAHRTVGATSTNAASSRSHAIFSVSLAAELRGADGLVRERLTSLHLVDLAGA
jgi:kinesin family protein 15